MTKQVEMVTITKEEYNRLVKDSIELGYLNRAGVDNWEWYGESFEGFQEELEKLGLDD